MFNTVLKHNYLVAAVTLTSLCLLISSLYINQYFLAGVDKLYLEISFMFTVVIPQIALWVLFLTTMISEPEITKRQINRQTTTRSLTD